jgi:NADPH:quinone reductase-like Zn-dependent oxidoreductase
LEDIMQAIVVTRYGGPEVLASVERPTPAPGRGEVVIEVAAAAVNPVDHAIRAGYLDHFVQGRFPVGLGWDVAGRVVAVGADVPDVTAGQAVIALLDDVLAPAAAYATHAVVKRSSLAVVPEGTDLVAASTLPLNSLTAVQALDLIDLAPGQSLLVTGAGGALGEYTVALGAARGLKVIGLGRPRDEADVLAAGAAGFVTDLAELDEVDAVLDAAQLGPAALARVRAGGSYVAVNDPAEPAPERGVRVTTVHVHADGAQLADLFAEVEAGRLRLRVAGTYPLAEAGAAQDRLAAGGVRGRLVLLT